jgi:hypothetical protein
MDELFVLDYNLKLLRGHVFNVDNIEIAPLTVGEIVDHGYSLYSEMLGIVTAKPEDVFKGLDIDINMTMFDHVISSGNPDLAIKFFDSIKYFIREDRDYEFDNALGLVFGNVQEDEIENIKVINSLNFNDIVDIIRYQNCVKYPDKKEEYNPKDERARKIIEKLNKAKKEVDKAKKKDKDNNVDFLSVVSAVSTKSNTINKFNVWDLNVYQLYDEFKRLEMINGYETSILAMLNGADIKDLKHWSSKMDV